MNNNINHNNKIKSIISKYGIDKSLDLIAGGKDTIKQIYINNPSEFLNQFNDLTPIEMDGQIYYVNKDRIPLVRHNQNKKYRSVWIDYYRIWLFFSEVIDMKTEEIKSIINNWLEQTYNITGLRPNEWYLDARQPLE
jgi:hypothetical protein